MSKMLTAQSEKHKTRGGMRRGELPKCQRFEARQRKSCQDAESSEDRFSELRTQLWKPSINTGKQRRGSTEGSLKGLWDQKTRGTCGNPPERNEEAEVTKSTLKLLPEAKLRNLETQRRLSKQTGRNGSWEEPLRHSTSELQTIER